MSTQQPQTTPISRWTLVNPDQPVQIVGGSTDRKFLFTSNIEPTVNFMTADGMNILTMSSSKLEYNREMFPNDTYRQAAMKVFDSFSRGLLYNFDLSERPVTLNFDAFGEHSAKHFKVHRDAIEHNYTLDTWHWWMLEELCDIIKRGA